MTNTQGEVGQRSRTGAVPMTIAVARGVVLETSAEHPLTLVLGGPGAGKTLLCKTIARSVLERTDLDVTWGGRLSEYAEEHEGFRARHGSRFRGFEMSNLAPGRVPATQLWEVSEGLRGRLGLNVLDDAGFLFQRGGAERLAQLAITPSCATLMSLQRLSEDPRSDAPLFERAGSIIADRHALRDVLARLSLWGDDAPSIEPIRSKAARVFDGRKERDRQRRGIARRSC